MRGESQEMKMIPISRPSAGKIEDPTCHRQALSGPDKISHNAMNRVVSYSPADAAIRFAANPRKMPRASKTCLIISALVKL